ncbi:MAG: glycosyltransferase [Clostridiales bacterium]|jgi:glycosyltransferase involved in cell wall biosynthesis|nr:glycosyltransferase [Clostridiales bacterium]
MTTISLCMIVKNEEDVLKRCLDSVKEAADEIIIVDTGSTDATKEIAREYTDKVYDFTWINDFSAARNYAFSKAEMDYQMWLDADDVLPERSLREIIALKETLNPAVDIVAMKYVTHADAQGNPIHVSTRERLIKRANNSQWMDPVHECIPLIGNVLYTEIEIHHKKMKAPDNPNRNMDIYAAREAAGQEFSPRQMYYYARELKDHGQWAKATQYFEMFLDTGNGWFEDNIATCHALSICYNQLGETEKALPILIKSFNYDAPRAEICSEIGYFYKHKRAFKTALKWFRFAASMDKPDTAGFILWDYYGYIPNIEACVCACELGDFAAAHAYNEKAAEYKPDSGAVAHNRVYLRDVMK